MNVSVSSHFLEKRRGGAIFGSLNDDRGGGVCGNGICDGEKRGGIGSGWDSHIMLEQHLTVICGLALRQFPRYKSKHHGLTHKDEDKRKWIEYK